jgi:hypothetical protein
VAIGCNGDGRNGEFSGHISDFKFKIHTERKWQKIQKKRKKN